MTQIIMINTGFHLKAGQNVGRAMRALALAPKARIARPTTVSSKVEDLNTDNP